MASTIRTTCECTTTQKSCCSTSTLQDEATLQGASVLTNEVNTLAYSPDLCINCGLCSIVCPHGVFVHGKNHAELIRAQVCMECGACQRNCPTGAIAVDNGVGCAAAMIAAALTGRQEATCGPRDDRESGCSSSNAQSSCCS